MLPIVIKINQIYDNQRNKDFYIRFGFTWKFALLIGLFFFKTFIQIIFISVPTVSVEDENEQSSVQFKVLTTSIKILFYAWGNWAQTICCLGDPQDACQIMHACMKKQRIKGEALTATGTKIWKTTASTLDIIQINNEAHVVYFRSTYYTNLQKKNAIDNFYYYIIIVHLFQLGLWRWLNRAPCCFCTVL